MSDSDIECPQCGAFYYHELTRCPECGWSSDWMANEENDKPPTDQKPGSSVFTGLALGWFVAALIGFTAPLVLRGFFLQQNGRLLARSLEALSYAIAAAAGGYTAEALVRRRPIAIGAVMGLLAVINSLLLQSLWRPLSSNYLLEPATIITMLVTLAAGPAGAFGYETMSSYRRGY